MRVSHQLPTALLTLLIPLLLISKAVNHCLRPRPDTPSRSPQSKQGRSHFLTQITQITQITQSQTPKQRYLLLTLGVLLLVLVSHGAGTALAQTSIPPEPLANPLSTLEDLPPIPLGAQPGTDLWLAIAQTVGILAFALGGTWFLRRYWQQVVHIRLVDWVSQFLTSSEPQANDGREDSSGTKTGTKTGTNTETNPAQTPAVLDPATAALTEEERLVQEQVALHNQATRQSLDRLLCFLLALAQWGIWIGTLLYITNLYPFTQIWSQRGLEALRLTLTQRFLSLGNTAYSLTDLLVLGIIFWGLIIGSSATTNLLKVRILSLTRISRGAQEVIASITRYLLIFLGTVTLLQVWGIDLSSLALLGGALGVGIGFGLQDIARDFSSGLVLLFERSIQVGDFIEVDEHMGTVEKVGPRSILLRTLDQISIIVPNSQFITHNVINWSHDNPVSRLRLQAPVAYGSDVEVVRSCLLTAALRNPEVLQSPAPKVVFLGYGDSALNFEIFAWIREPDRQLPITSDLFFSIEEQFRAHGVEVPFPQQDLHVRSGHLPIQLSPALEQTLTQLLQQMTPPAATLAADRPPTAADPASPEP